VCRLSAIGAVTEARASAAQPSEREGLDWSVTIVMDTTANP